jgi:hypothetical protein
MITITDKSEGDNSPDNRKPFRAETPEEAWEFIQGFALPNSHLVLQDGDNPTSLRLTKKRLQDALRDWGVAHIFYDSLANDPILIVVSD